MNKKKNRKNFLHQNSTLEDAVSDNKLIDDKDALVTYFSQPENLIYIQLLITKMIVTTLSNALYYMEIWHVHL